MTMGEQKTENEKLEDGVLETRMEVLELCTVLCRPVPYSWRNNRRSFDGARICGRLVVFPKTPSIELKGITA